MGPGRDRTRDPFLLSVRRYSQLPEWVSARMRDIEKIPSEIIRTTATLQEILG